MEKVVDDETNQEAGPAERGLGSQGKPGDGDTASGVSRASHLPTSLQGTRLNGAQQTPEPGASPQDAQEMGQRL